MKKKIFLGLGAAGLAICGAFAGRATAKFGAATNLYYGVPSSCTSTTSLASISSTIAFLTSPVGGGTAAKILTSNNTTVQLFADNGCTKPIYFQP